MDLLITLSIERSDGQIKILFHIIRTRPN